MTITSFRIGFERKIGYSFVGLLVGNVASLVLLLLMALLQRVEWFHLFRRLWSINVSEAFGWSLVVWFYSMPAWAMVGLPVVLLLSARLAADLYWALAALIGAVLGACAMLLIYFTINGGHASLAAFRNPDAPLYFAALIAGVAFLVYCKLVRAALRRQTRKSGAPFGAPQFFSVPD